MDEVVASIVGMLFLIWMVVALGAAGWECGDSFKRRRRR